jgi:hypothetical protein
MRLPEFTGPTPRTLPPFLSGAIFAHPQGQIWVQRTGPTMTAPLFDVFGEDANRAYQVSLSTPGHRLVGLGKACAYVVAQSPEGGERLSCFAYP